MSGRTTSDPYENVRSHADDLPSDIAATLT